MAYDKTKEYFLILENESSGGIYEKIGFSISLVDKI
jgi:hypothetical protein